MKHKSPAEFSPSGEAVNENYAFNSVTEPTALIPVRTIRDTEGHMELRLGGRGERVEAGRVYMTPNIANDGALAVKIMERRGHRFPVRTYQLVREGTRFMVADRQDMVLGASQELSFPVSGFVKIADSPGEREARAVKLSEGAVHRAPADPAGAAEMYFVPGVLEAIGDADFRHGLDDPRPLGGAALSDSL